MPKQSIPGPELYNACLAGDAAAVSRLLPAGGTRLNLNGSAFQHPATKSTPLMVAAMNGRTEIVRMILERAPKTAVNHMRGHSPSALIRAAQYHHADILQLLAERGGNLANKYRMTPLWCAVGPINPPYRDSDPDGARQLATVRALLQLGAGTFPHRPLLPYGPAGLVQPFLTQLSRLKISVCHSQLTAGLIHLINIPTLNSSPAGPDPVDGHGMTPLCNACELGLPQVALALLAGGANIDFATLPRHRHAGVTPLMFAAFASHAGVAKLLLKRGANGTNTSTVITRGVGALCTALDIARLQADRGPAFAETFAVLRRRCCSTCGMTSPGLSEATAGEEQHLKRCGNCPASGPRARYCGKQCQRADWVLRHRGECAEARRARQAASTEV